MRRRTYVMIGAAACMLIFVLSLKRSPPPPPSLVYEDDVTFQTAVRSTSDGWLYKASGVEAVSDPSVQPRHGAEQRALRWGHLSPREVSVLNPVGPGRLLTFRNACFSGKTLAALSQPVGNASLDEAQHGWWMAWRKAYDEAVAEGNEKKNEELNIGEAVEINGERLDDTVVDADEYVWIDEFVVRGPTAGAEKPRVARVSRSVLDRAAHVTRLHGSAAYFVLGHKMGNLLHMHEHFFAIVNAKIALMKEIGDAGRHTERQGLAREANEVVSKGLFNELDTIITLDAALDPAFPTVFPVLKTFAQPARLVMQSSRDLHADDVFCASLGAFLTRISFTLTPTESASEERESDTGQHRGSKGREEGYAAEDTTAASGATKTIVEANVRHVALILRAHMLFASLRDRRTHDVRSDTGSPGDVGLNTTGARPRIAFADRDKSPRARNPLSLIVRLLDDNYSVRHLAPKNISFVEAVSLVSRSDAVIGVHGSEMMHALYLPPGGSIVLICPFGMALVCSEYYERLAAILRLEYRVVHVRLSDTRWPSLPARQRARQRALVGDFRFLAQQDLVLNTTVVVAAIADAVHSAKDKMDRSSSADCTDGSGLLGCGDNAGAPVVPEGEQMHNANADAVSSSTDNNNGGQWSNN